MDQSKLRSYLLYASGEIILVMIGILLALQVNNWNETRKNEARFITILKEIQDDIITDVTTINELQPLGLEVDSLANKILSGEVTRENYMDPDQSDLFWVGLQYMQFSQQTTAYQKLKELDLDENLSVIYKELLAEINSLYINQSELLNSRQEIFIETIEERHDYLSKNYDWYHKLRSPYENPSDEMIDYYLNDPEYKNFLSRYRSDQLYAPFSYIMEYEDKATVVYFLIRESLGSKETPDIFSDVFEIKEQPQVTEFAGKYTTVQNNPFEVEISIQAGIPLIRLSGYNDSRHIIVKRDSAYVFHNDHTSKLSFNPGSSGSIDTLIITAGQQNVIKLVRKN